MLKSMLVAGVSIIGLMIVWVLIQSLWRKTFHEYIIEDDVLAGRNSCSNCGCTTACKNSKGKLIGE